MRRATLVLCTAFMTCSTFMTAGCNSRQLETGYTYTPLGDSPTRRRGYYADPFSPEARIAQQDRQADVQTRREIPGQ